MWPWAHALPDNDAIAVDGGRLEYAIRTSDRRRSLSLQVHADGSVRVAVPSATPRGAIQAFVAQHAGWVAHKRREAAAVAARRAGPVLVEGTSLPFQGDLLLLQPSVRPGARSTVRRRADRLHVSVAAHAQIRPAVEAWYRGEAACYTAARCEHYAPHVGRAPSRIVVRGQRTRWGSCSTRGTISINWRLMQARADVMDYVIVHELCHLLHANHSARFWEAVARVMPDYPARRQALRALVRTLVL